MLPCLQGTLRCQYPFELGLYFLQRNTQKWPCCHRELGPGAWPRRVKIGHWQLCCASPFTLRCCQGPRRGKTHEETGKNYFVLFCIRQARMEQPLKAGTIRGLGAVGTLFPSPASMTRGGSPLSLSIFLASHLRAGGCPALTECPGGDSGPREASSEVLRGSMRAGVEQSTCLEPLRTGPTVPSLPAPSHLSSLPIAGLGPTLCAPETA